MTEPTLNDLISMHSYLSKVKQKTEDINATIKHLETLIKRAILSIEATET